MSIFDNVLDQIRRRQGLPPLVPPTPEELAERRAADEARNRAQAEEARIRYAEFLADAPRYDLGNGRYARSETMLGRLSSGAESDKGTLRHVLPEGLATALCGAKPGMRSVGWSDPLEHEATCPRCLSRLARLGGRPC